MKSKQINTLPIFTYFYPAPSFCVSFPKNTHNMSCLVVQEVTAPAATVTTNSLSDSEYCAYQNLKFHFRENAVVYNLSLCVAGHLYATGAVSVDTVLDRPIYGMYSTTAHNAGLSAIHYAAAYGLLDLFDWLFTQGVNLNKQDSKGMTALHYAVLFQNETMISHLLDLGADASICDSVTKDRWTPKELAERFHTYECGPESPLPKRISRLFARTTTLSQD